MTRRWVLLVGAALLATIPLMVPEGARAGHDDCTVAELDGVYVFTANGFTTISPATTPTSPKAIVEVIHFNGDGTAEASRATRSINGNPIEENPGSNGTYTVNPVPFDGVCQGSLTFAGGAPNFDLYFVQANPDVIWEIQTDKGNVFQGAATKVSHH